MGKIEIMALELLMSMQSFHCKHGEPALRNVINSAFLNVGKPIFFLFSAPINTTLNLFFSFFLLIHEES